MDKYYLEEYLGGFDGQRLSWHASKSTDAISFETESHMF